MRGDQLHLDSGKLAWVCQGAKRNWNAECEGGNNTWEGEFRAVGPTPPPIPLFKRGAVAEDALIFPENCSSQSEAPS